MSETLETTEDGRFRVVLEQDTDSGVPEGGSAGHVYRCERGTVDLLGTDYDTDREAGSIRHAMVDALSRFGRDWDLVTRYLRMWHDVVALDYLSRDYGEIVGIVTRDLAESWGCDVDTVTPELTEWEAWADGDVYGYVIEERVALSGHTSTGRGYRLERECWETVDYDDSALWGLYGREYAEEAAREAWGHFLDTVTVAEVRAG